MDNTQWVSDTRRVITTGPGQLAVQLKTEVQHALEIKQGDIVEIKVRNTGAHIEPVKRGEKSGGFTGEPDEVQNS